MLGDCGAGFAASSPHPALTLRPTAAGLRPRQSRSAGWGSPKATGANYIYKSKCYITFLGCECSRCAWPLESLFNLRNLSSTACLVDLDVLAVFTGSLDCRFSAFFHMEAHMKVLVKFSLGLLAVLGTRQGE